MNTFKAILITLLFLTSATVAGAQSSKSIQLNDGSTIQGKVVGMSNGVYTIETPSMGTIELTEDKIMNIVDANQAAGPMMNNQGLQQQVMQMQQQIFSDPALMAEVQALAQDPEIMQLLSDPALMQAATQMDVNGVGTHPNAQKLMTNPKMQELMEKIANEQGY